MAGCCSWVGLVSRKFQLKGSLLRRNSVELIQLLLHPRAGRAELCIGHPSARPAPTNFHLFHMRHKAYHRIA